MDLPATRKGVLVCLFVLFEKERWVLKEKGIQLNPALDLGRVTGLNMIPFAKLHRKKLNETHPFLNIFEQELFEHYVHFDLAPEL